MVQIKITYNKSSFALGRIQHIPNESAFKILAFKIIINTDSGLKTLNSKHSIQDRSDTRTASDSATNSRLSLLETTSDLGEINSIIKTTKIIITKGTTCQK